MDAAQLLAWSDLMSAAWPAQETSSAKRRRRARHVAIRWSQLQQWSIVEALQAAAARGCDDMGNECDDAAEEIYWPAAMAAEVNQRRSMVPAQEVTEKIASVQAEEERPTRAVKTPASAGQEGQLEESWSRLGTIEAELTQLMKTACQCNQDYERDAEAYKEKIFGSHVKEYTEMMQEEVLVEDDAHFAKYGAEGTNVAELKGMHNAELTQLVKTARQCDERDAEACKEKIVGGHVKEYMEMIQEKGYVEDDARFAKYGAEGTEGAELKGMHMAACEKIREAPLGEQTDKKYVTDVPKDEQQICEAEKDEGRRQAAAFRSSNAFDGEPARRRYRPLAFLTEEDLSRAAAAAWSIALTVTEAVEGMYSNS